MESYFSLWYKILKSLPFKGLIDLKKKINQGIEEASPFLENGYYNIEYREKIILYKKNEKTIEFIVNNEEQLKEGKYNLKQHLKNLVRRTTVRILFPIPLRIKQVKQADYQGELVIITYEGNVKIFDFNNRLVINKIKDPAILTRIIGNYSAFTPFFPTTFESAHPTSQIIIEKYIAFQPYSYLSVSQKNEILQQLFINYQAYFNYWKNFNLDHITVDTVLNILGKYPPESDLIDSLMEGISSSHSKDVFPHIQSHGDLCFKNIITNEHQSYLIDWEMSTHYFFFHDLLNIFIEEACRGEFAYLSSYMKGDYDKRWEELFQNFHLNFDRNARDYYLYLVIAEKVDFINGKNDIENIDTYFSQYILLVNKIQSMKKVER